MRSELRFLRDGRLVRLAAADPQATLLDHLRLDERATGTKEGCAEGDCGACTVVLRRLRGGRLVTEAVNSCILFLGQIDGAEVIAVDDLADGATLHPVQRAMVDHHGSQCGFCTPGIVMSLFALHQAEGPHPPTRQQVLDRLAGNLCRCTGYRPIVDAALDACATPADDRFARNRAETARALEALDDGEDIFVGDERRFLASPASVASLAELCATHPDATLVAGATDLGLWSTKQLRDLPKTIFLGRVRGLDAIDAHDDRIEIGAAATHTAAMPHLGAIDPDLGEIWRRFASDQVRNSGTVGGNIANGSPIGDGPPALIALGARLVLQRGGERREMMLDDYFLAYGKQDRRPGEFVRAVVVPRLAANERFRAYKISRRFDQDISAIMMALKVQLDGRAVGSARLAYGGMAATPKRARATETALAGLSLDSAATWDAALAALRDDFAPIDDHRASASYRRRVAGNLLRKALMEIAGAPSGATRVVGHRERDLASAL